MLAPPSHINLGTSQLSKPAFTLADPLWSLLPYKSSVSVIEMFQQLTHIVLNYDSL